MADKKKLSRNVTMYFYADVCLLQSDWLYVKKVMEDHAAHLDYCDANGRKRCERILKVLEVLDQQESENE